MQFLSHNEVITSQLAKVTDYRRHHQTLLPLQEINISVDCSPYLVVECKPCW